MNETHPTPIDEVARRVVYTGGDQWAQATNLCGVRFGKLEVLRADGNGLYVLKCGCGNYELWSRHSIFNPKRSACRLCAPD